MHRDLQLSCVFAKVEAFATKLQCAAEKGRFKWVLIDISYTQRTLSQSHSQCWFEFNVGVSINKKRQKKKKHFYHQYITRIQSRPGKRILWRTISPIMHPTDHISTVLAKVREKRKREEAEVRVRLEKPCWREQSSDKKLAGQSGIINEQCVRQRYTKLWERRERRVTE